MVLPSKNQWKISPLFNRNKFFLFVFRLYLLHSNPLSRKTGGCFFSSALGGFGPGGLFLALPFFDPQAE